jgi:elongation factor G
MSRGLATGARCVALVGPYLSGKTTLLEALLFATGAIKRKGTVKDGNSIGDSAPEARARQMSTEPTFAQTEFLGDAWTLIDCPGSIELFQDTVNSMAVADVAIVVCEPDPQKAIAMRPIIQYLQKERIPHMIFINKIDQATEPVQTILEAIQQNSEWPLVLRELPIVAGEKITGYVDLVSERAFQYRAGQASMMISIPGQIEDEKALARQEMLEALADFDDSLLEQLLEDVVPPTEDIYAQVTRDMQNGLIVPVFLGIADQDHGVRRLLKALRHEVPGPGVTAERFGIKDQKPPKALVFKTLHAAQLGKLSIARIFSGEIDEGIELQGKRVGAMLRLMGNQQVKVTRANLGEIVAFGRLSDISTGCWLGPENEAEDLIRGLPEALSSVFGLALETKDRSDEVKLTSALQRLCDEDPSLTWRQDSDVNQLVLEGQGDIHLQLAIDRLENRYKISVRTSSIQVPYKETIKKQISQHARYKRQTGGHGMFGDVHVDIKPLERGKGFEFHETIVGGGVCPSNTSRLSRPASENICKRVLLGFQLLIYQSR